MATARPYRARRRPATTERTRGRITAAVRELLAEGTFHDSTVEAVADRAGVSRATLYQHFGSRIALVDSICEAFAVNPALVAVRKAIDLPDLDEAVAETAAQSCRFWASEEAVLEQLYGVSAIDPAARGLVERQTRDRHGELKRLAARIRDARRLPAGTSERRALAHLLVVTSFETFRELRRRAGLSEREVVRSLQDAAAKLVLS
jgi:AcrR family transcriptional regulator